MGRCVRALAVALALAAGPTRLSHAQNVTAVADGRIARLEQWLKAAALHEPGTEDEWPMLAGPWASAAVGPRWIGVSLLVRVMRNPSGVGFNVRPEDKSRAQAIRYTSSQIHRIQALACAAAGTLANVRCAQLKAANELDDQLRHV